MRTLVWAFVGLIIFVNQPGTLILVADSSVQKTECYNRELPTAIIAGVTLDVSPDRFFVLPYEVGTIREGSDYVPVQLIGPRRGPVK